METLLKQQIQVLVQLALVDREFDEAEKAAITKIGLENGGNQQEIDGLLNHSHVVETFEPMTDEQRMNFMIDCIMVVIADDKINPQEDQFVKNLADKLGFKKEVVTFLIEYQTMDRHILRDLMKSYLL
jgi:uncharacterized tellurite resistance protein B-like protein